MRSAMVVPMKAGGATIGALTFVNADSARAFDDDDLTFAEDLAARAATAVENARLYTRLAQTADTLQASLLPERLAQPPGWRIAASYEAGERGTEVGGDFYDVFPVPEGWMVVLGDVTGKGVKAAALTALARHTAKTAARFDPRPAAVLSQVNAVLREQAELSLVTVVCALLRPVGGGVEVSLASAGHPLPLRVSGDGSVAPLGRFDIVLGAVDDGEWTESAAAIAPGDTLLFYTDGVTDARGVEDRFGEERLVEAAGDGPNGAAELIARLEARLAEFETGEGADDRAMLAVEWVGAPQPANVA
jgi:serine phosphatase RsbU (regulator of sigma subunit)